jgi:DNA-binding HxlR family transcriptional regulator
MYIGVMKRTSFRKWPCSIARTMDLLGDWWTPLVLRELVYGSDRFDDIQAALGIGRNVLAQRLQRLTREGMVERRKYQDRPARYAYVATEKGRDFFPVLAAITRWGDRWLDGAKGPPILLRHKTCGEITHGEVVCAHCHADLKLDDVEFEVTPGRAVTLDDRIKSTERLAAAKARQ